MQPNAPGTQGYDAYAYVANNPTRWLDPTGHYTSDEAVAAYVLANPRFLPLPVFGTVATAQLAPGLTKGMVLAAGFGVVAYLAFETVGCVIDSECRAATLAMIQEMGRYGADTWEGVREWTAEQLAKIEYTAGRCCSHTSCRAGLCSAEPAPSGLRRAAARGHQPGSHERADTDRVGNVTD